MKGPSYLSNWIDVPTNIIIDYMHASSLGTTKNLLNIWLSTENSKKSFYLGLKIKLIDQIVMQVKYSIEFPRQQRSISCYLPSFKATELRNFIFYIGLPVLRNFLSHEHFVHFVEYVVFLRLLSDKNIRTSDNLITFEIIAKYIEK